MEQNDCRFRIETTPTKELMKEGFRTVVWFSWRPVFFGAMAAFSVWKMGDSFYNASCWVRLYNQDTSRQFILLGLCWLALAALAVGYVLVFPSLSAKRYMRQNAALFGDMNALLVTRQFCDDCIHSTSSTGTELQTAYDQIISVWETAHGIVLRRKMNLFEMLDKSRIESGTLEDFKAFLQEKMPDAKFHWKQNA